MKKELQLLGLTKNESLVYETLVKQGSSKAGSVISKLDLHRNLIYRALDGLVSNGYASKVVRNGVWHFETTNPQSLLTSQRRREKMYEDVLKEIAHYKKEDGEQIVVYEGVLSYRRFWLQKVAGAPKNSTFLSAGKDFETLFKVLGPKKEKFIDAVNGQKISFRLISFGKTKGVATKGLGRVEIRTHAPQNKDVLGNFVVTHDSVVVEVRGERPKIVEMKDSALVSTFNNYFDVMWDKARKS